MRTCTTCAKLMDEVFGAENFVCRHRISKTTGQAGQDYSRQLADYLLWYAQRPERVEVPPTVSTEGARRRAVRRSTLASSCRTGRAETVAMRRSQRSCLPPELRDLSARQLTNQRTSQDLTFAVRVRRTRTITPATGTLEDDRGWDWSDLSATRSESSRIGNTLRYVRYLR